MAEWLGKGLQNLLRRFESARDLLNVLMAKTYVIGLSLLHASSIFNIGCIRFFCIVLPILTSSHLTLNAQTHTSPSSQPIAIEEDSLAYVRKQSLLIFIERVFASYTDPLTNRLDLRDLHLDNSLLGLIPKHITHLNLARTKISSLHQLPEEMYRLVYLNVSGNDIQDISPLRRYLGLTNLNLSKTQVQNIATLSSLKNLSILDLKRTKVSDISSIKTLTELWFLDLTKTNIKNIDAVTSLGKLSWISIGGTRVSNLAPLRRNSQLSSVILAGCKYVRDLNPLKNLKNLKDLYLMETNITDITPLSNLDLNDVWLFGSPVKNTDVFKPQPKNLILRSKAAELNVNKHYDRKYTSGLQEKANQYQFNEGGLQQRLFAYEYAKAQLSYTREDFSREANYFKNRWQLTRKIIDKYTPIESFFPHWVADQTLRTKKEITRLSKQGKDELEIIKYFEKAYKKESSRFTDYTEKVAKGTYEGRIGTMDVISPQRVKKMLVKQKKELEHFKKLVQKEIEKNIESFEYLKPHRGYLESERHLILRMLDDKLYNKKDGLSRFLLEYYVMKTLYSQKKHKKKQEQQLYHLYKIFEKHLSYTSKIIDDVRSAYAHQKITPIEVQNFKNRYKNQLQKVHQFKRSIEFGKFQGFVTFEGEKHHIISPKNPQKKFIQKYINSFKYPLVYKPLTVYGEYSPEEKRLIQAYDQFFIHGKSGLNDLLMKNKLHTVRQQKVDDQTYSAIKEYLTHRYQEVEFQNSNYQFEKEVPKYTAKQFPDEITEADRFKFKKDQHEKFRTYVSEGRWGGRFKNSLSKIVVYPLRLRNNFWVSSFNKQIIGSNYVEPIDYFPSALIYGKWSARQKSKWFHSMEKQVWDQGNQHLYSVAKIIAKNVSNVHEIRRRALKKCSENFQQFFVYKQYKKVYKGIIPHEYFILESPGKIVTYSLCSRKYVK